MKLINYSKFDSDIFKKNVGKVTITNSNQITNIVKEINEYPYNKVFAFIPIINPISYGLELNNFHFISIRSSYTMHVKKSDLISDGSVKIIQLSKQKIKLEPKDIDSLVDTIGSTSRYFKDSQISRDAAQKVYLSWINNSLENNYVSEIFLAYVNDSLAGWLSLKNSKFDSSIDLIGVLPNFQGQGIGTKLILYANNYLDKNIVTLNTVTEGENISAINFYTKCGFILNKVELIYHYHSI